MPSPKKVTSCKEYLTSHGIKVTGRFKSPKKSASRSKSRSKSRRRSPGRPRGSGRRKSTSRSKKTYSLVFEPYMEHVKDGKHIYQVIPKNKLKEFFKLYDLDPYMDSSKMEKVSWKLEDGLFVVTTTERSVTKRLRLKNYILSYDHGGFEVLKNNKYYYPHLKFVK